VFFDSEESGTESVAKAAAKTFCEALTAKGFKCGIYASYDWFKRYLGGDELKQYVQWVAKWSEPEPKGFSNMQLWQYSAYGTVSGIGRGSVDMDKPYGDILKVLSGVNPDPAGGKIMIAVDVLKKGSKGPEVFTVQSILRAKGYKYERKLIECDSSYGKITEACVIQYQKDNKLTADGIVGANTWNKLVNG
jgi:hypothetical protein